MQPLHVLFHECKLLSAGAVACIIFGAECIQIFGKAFQGIVKRQFGKVESSYKDIGAEPVGDVENSFVGAAAEQHFSAFSIRCPFCRLFDEQILFMAEIFREESIFPQNVQAGTYEAVFPYFFLAGTEGQPVPDDSCAVGKNQTLAAGKRNIQPDIFFRAMVMRFKGMAVQIDGSCLIYFQKSFKAAAMVVMPVGEDGDVYGRKVDAKRGGILGKQAGLPHIKENLVFFRFYIQTQSMFGEHIFPFRCIFKQSSDFHSFSMSFLVFGVLGIIACYQWEGKVIFNRKFALLSIHLYTITNFVVLSFCLVI